MKPPLVFSLLLPLSVGGFEVFTFLLDTPASEWTKLPWSRIDTVCLAGWLDPDLVSLAHSTNTRVAFIANYPKDQLLNATNRKAWVQEQLEYAKKNHLDGVNFDFEDPLEAGSPESKAYTRLLKETVAVFHRQLPGSKVGSF